MKRKALTFAMGTALIAMASPAMAWQDAPDPPPGTAPMTPAPTYDFNSTIVGPEVVTAFYDKFKPGSVWLDRGDFVPAVNQMLAILDRAKIDGFAAGPQMAETIRREMTAGIPTDPAKRAAFDRLISRAWLSYVATIRAPVPGMLYGADYVKPKPVQPHEVLLTAKGVPNLPEYLADIARVNYFYDRIRAAEWKRLGQQAMANPDPRVIANLERTRAMPLKGRYLVVDSASQTLYMIEDGAPVDSMKVIVGKKAYATPMVASMIHYATMNPYWHVPDHLARQIVARGVLNDGKKYADPRGYEVVDAWAYDANVLPLNSVDWKGVQSGKVDVRVRQRPGPANSMGDIKFDFPNPEGIYLHDTPSKQYFKESSRDLSNGCIRLEDAMRLGRWLLRAEPQAPEGNKPEQFVPLPVGTAVYVTYITADVNEEGSLAFRKDIYNWDPAAESTAVGSY